MTLFRVQQIPIRLHPSFLLLAALYVGMQAFSGGLTGALVAAVLGLMLFASVALHELGHALAARRYGISTQSITLYPFGGIAALIGAPKPGQEEAVISLAGPAVNIALAALSLPLYLLDVPLAEPLLYLNLMMGVFNLLPAYPMDGGRVLRSLLVWRGHAPLDATERALKLSQVFAWGFVAAGYLFGTSLMLLGGVLIWMIRQEKRRVRAQRA